ncbi:MAG TPA: hypothetical protein PK867_21675 [Pirellulales bacterium]|nr:hypothetical protein [Pirellulales bacterium]
MAHVPRLLLTLPLTAAILLITGPATAQPGGAPAATGPEMPWQVAVLFTVNWVLAAVAVAILSRPSKRPDKPKKVLDEEAA